MGGFGSGRQGGRVTIQGTASYVLNARFLRGLRPGIKGSGDSEGNDGFVANITINVGQYDALADLLAFGRALGGSRSSRQPAICRHGVQTIRPVYPSSLKTPIEGARRAPIDRRFFPNSYRKTPMAASTKPLIS